MLTKLVISDIGSITMHEASSFLAMDWIARTWVSALPIDARLVTICNIPLSTKGWKSIDTDFRLPSSSSARERKLIKTAFSPRAQAAATKAPQKVVLPVPGNPVNNIQDVRK